MTDENALSEVNASLSGLFESSGMTTNDSIFVFSPRQKKFLANLRELKDVQGAALSVGWPIQAAIQFIKSRKFKKLIASKMQDHMTQESMTTARWWQFCKALTDGYIEKAVATCPLCNLSEPVTMYEVEQAKSDDLTLDMRCSKCGQKADVEVTQEPFKKTRESVVGWQEWGARVTPKIERVQHEFSSETFTFKTEDAQ